MSGTKTRALKAAFPYTIPILTGFLFVGLAYGIYMRAAGFGIIFPVIISMMAFAGSMQFVAVGLLLAAFDPLNAFILTLMVNARHLFYGIAMLEKYNIPGLRRIFLIFGMCDESFSINSLAEPPEDVDSGWFMFFVTLLNYSYWAIGTAVGGLFGSLIKFSTAGIDFVIPALVTTLFLEQWFKEKKHYSSLLGLGLSLISLLIFGSSRFIIPAMVLIIAALTALQKPIEKAGAAQ
ncbi:MAG: branched-chain amino acid transporter AzlC [Clostridiales bacterium]|nr:branched-chain amino acid transporter AzlC [Clostridiales bacterium]